MAKLRSRPRSVEISETGIHVFESQHGPDFSMEMGTWNYDKVCVVRGGKGHIETPDKKIAISDDNVVYLPAGHTHRFVDNPDDPMILMMICFYPSVFDGLASGRSAFTEFVAAFPAFQAFDPRRTHRSIGIADALKLMLFEQSRGRTGYDAVIWCEALELLVMLTRSYREVENLVEVASGGRAFARSLAYLEDNFIHPVGVQDLADIAGLSYRRYTDVFRLETGRTVNRYIGDLRFDYAVERLLETGNIQYASIDAGFGDLAHFYRVFKARMGTTPRRYFLQNVKS